MAWDDKLTRKLVLLDGQELVTLRDAAEFLITRFAGARRSRPLEYAIELLMKAELTGQPRLIRAATNQVALVLRQRGLLR